jgi:hypothetical protein
MAETVKVQATAPGYYLGPRAVGAKFDMPLGPKGEIPKSKWFKVISPAPANVKAKPVIEADDELA